MLIKSTDAVSNPAAIIGSAHVAEPGPPGQLPSIEQVMPWLHLLFDAWEDYKRMREREAAEHEAAEREAQLASERGEESDDDDDHRKDKKKKRHKDRDKK
jgi:hypothetical protein